VHDVVGQAVQLASETVEGYVVAQAAHVLVKKGVVEVAVTLPEKPALHEQPLGTLVPAEFVGHAAAEHVGALLLQAPGFVVPPQVRLREPADKLYPALHEVVATLLKLSEFE